MDPVRSEVGAVGSGAMLLCGQVDGDIHAELVRIGAGARVRGHVDCAQIDIAGQLNGSLNCVDAVVRRGASVRADEPDAIVCAGMLVVDGGIDGRVLAAQVRINAPGRLGGSLEADAIDVGGRLGGRARGVEVLVRRGAVVEARLRYAKLSFEPGAQDCLREDWEPMLPIELPVRLMRRLDDPVAGAAVGLSLSGGAELPDWIHFDPRRRCIFVTLAAMDGLAARRQSMVFTLRAGSDALTFSLPPEAA